MSGLTQGHKTKSALLSNDTAVKASAGYIYAITIAYKGMTAGEFITLNDSTDGSGSDAVMVVFPGANGTYHFIWPEGLKFDNGIYFNAGARAAAANVYAVIQYK